MAAAFLLASFAVQAQSAKLSFCESVSSTGLAEGVYSSFSIPEAGGYLYFHVAMDGDVGTTDIGYEIYRINDDGTETYSTTIYQTTELDWEMFWSQVTFYTPGKYRVTVVAWYDEWDWWGTELAESTVEIVKE